MAERDLEGELDAFLAGHQAEFVDFRRDLHAHPEIGYHEHRTTRRVKLRLEAAGLRPTILPKGTGLIVDIGSRTDPVIALRADLDALPISDEKNVAYRSTVANACHACGHDVHTTILLGTGLFLARVGAITAACDKITVRVTGPGGHTARPHLTADLVYALGKIITELPAALSRRVDPRSSLSLVWGRVNAGAAANAIPDDGFAEGTVRCLDDDAWHAAPDLLKALIESVASAYGVVADLSYVRNVPPTVNEAISTAMVEAAADRVLGTDAVVPAPQSLGGEDFAWYLESIPGALVRLGTRKPGSGDDFDIHQPTFDVDERAIGVGIRLMAATALTAIRGGASAPEPLPGVAHA